jgi:hypothetical protein
MEEDPDSNMLSGTPATPEVVQQTVFVNQAPVLPVQKNKAAEVIGWLVGSMEVSSYSVRCSQ